MPEFTVIAFDWGEKNIGLACGNSLLQSASELTPLRARDGQPNWAEVENILNEWKPNTVLVGLPFNMDGSESESTRRALKFGQRLRGRFAAKVEFMDERLSSFEAKTDAKTRGHRGNYAENPIDSAAACLILQSWWRKIHAAENQ